MKSKCIPKKNHTSYYYFLLLIVPILLGFVIFFSPQAHSEWNEENMKLSEKSPLNQGWVPMNYTDPNENEKSPKIVTSEKL